MNGKRQNKEELFNAAAELTDSGERQAFLEEACAGNAQLHQEIEKVLTTMRTMRVKPPY